MTSERARFRADEDDAKQQSAGLISHMQEFSDFCTLGVLLFLPLWACQCVPRAPKGHPNDGTHEGHPPCSEGTARRRP